MAPSEPETELTATEARGGTTPGVMRYVLGISLALIVVFFAILLFAFG